MKCVIGVVGENGAGKDTFTSFLTAAAAPQTVSKLHFSDILYDSLKMWGIKPTRSNLQNLAIIMDKEFGKGSLTRATKLRISDNSSDIIVIEGVRWKTDVPMIRSFEKSLLVYVTAAPELRFQRMKIRGEKASETSLDYKQFQKEEKAATEIEIPEIGKRADFILENNGSLDEFRKSVEKFALKLK